jgi:NAD(P)-dependent dehydrogenase (short-subunit alcohol dehydrogenase family)
MIDTPLLQEVAKGLGTSLSSDMFGAGPAPALRRLGDAEEVAELVAFLLSPLSGFISGAVINIDGGMSF